MPRGVKKAKRRGSGELSDLSSLPPSPVDNLTGIVLSIFITPEDFIGPEKHKHHPNFDRTRSELQGAGGKAVRSSRVEILPIHLHHASYEGSTHDTLAQPEKLPGDPAGQATLAALYVAGVLPRDSVDLKSDDPLQPKRLSNKEYAFLSSPQITNVDGMFKRNANFRRQEIGSFFIDHALQEDFVGDTVRANERFKFINATEIARIKELGNYIIMRSIREALMPAAALYKEAKKEGMVRSGRPDFHSSVTKVLPMHEFINYYPRLKCILSYDPEPESSDVAAVA